LFDERQIYIYVTLTDNPLGFHQQVEITDIFFFWYRVALIIGTAPLNHSKILRTLPTALKTAPQPNIRLSNILFPVIAE